MLAPDTVLQSRYRIVRQLGQGGMGAVYEAIDERLDTTVALKETLFSDEKLRKQFEREARLLARLHHQALPRVSDHFNEGDGQFLVMQYIAGEDLAEMQSHRSEPFAPDEVLRWADQLCDALDYLHTQDPQIIHRDIKPQNLKLTARGQIVLLDFGLAKGFAGQMSVVTTSASIFGYTPNYAPLEQVQGLGTDARSDIYSLAATLYHLLTSVKPPDALSRAGALVNGQPDPLIPANTLTPAVSAAVSAALNIGMSQKRDDRYPSATAMRAGLRAADGQFDETLLAASPAYAAASTVSGEAKTRIAGEQTRGVAGEAQTLIAADATRLRSSVPRESTVVGAPGARKSRVWLAAPLVLLALVGGVAGFYAYRSRQQQQATPVPAATPQDPSAGRPTPAANVNSVSTSTPATEEKNQKKTAETSSQRGVKAKPEQPVTVVPSPADRGVPAEASQQHEQRGRNPNPDPLPPNFDPFNQPGRHPNRQPGPEQMPNIRTFPNGTRVIIQPDGTRIMTMPNGSTRVIPPGVKPNRRKNP